MDAGIAMESDGPYQALIERMNRDLDQLEEEDALTVKPLSEGRRQGRAKTLIWPFIEPSIKQVVMPDSTRDRLVSTAMRLFLEKGYGATSVADLLEAAGVDSEGLDGLFSGKQDLLLAVLDAYRSGIREMLLEPAWRDVTDPIEKIFSLLARYRQLIVETDCLYGCPIGSLALEIHEPDPPVRELLAANFQAWTDAVLECLLEAGRRLPDALDRLSLAEFVLTTMEGAVMQTRTFRDVAYFDRAVQELRNYVEILLYGRPSLSSPVRQALAHFGRGQRRADQG